MPDFLHRPIRDNRLRWKYGYASYHHHIPLEYHIVEKGDPADFRHPQSEVKIQPLTLGHEKSKYYTLNIRDDEGKNYTSHTIYLPDYRFWIPRRMIRRGPGSWSIKKDRWVHKDTFNRCLKRAYWDGKQDYPGWNW